MRQANLIGLLKLARRWLWSTPGRLLLGVVFSLGLGWLAIRGMDWQMVGRQFQDFPIYYAIASLAFFVLVCLLRAYRWKVLFMKERVPLLRLYIVQNAGIGLNNVSPVRVVSEAAQFAILTLRYKMKGGLALATLGMERVLDFVATTLLLLALMVLIPRRETFLPYLAAASIITLGAVGMVRVIAWSSGRQFVRRTPFLLSFATWVAALERARGTLAYSLFLTLLYWVLVGLCAWILAYGMELGVSPMVVILAMLGSLFFATALPGLPGAVGNFEFAIVYVLGFFGVARAEAFSFAVVLHAILFLPPLAFAIAFLMTTGFTLARRPAIPFGEKVEQEPAISSSEGDNP
jgi:hypothetical protein